MAKIYYGKRGELRIYSGEPDGLGGVFYFRVAFAQMDFNAPLGRPRPDQLPVTDRGGVNRQAHYIQGPDDIILQPLNITFTANLDTEVNQQDLVRALSNPHRVNPWTVGGVSWANTNGTSFLYNGCGSAVSVPLPDDPLHDRVDLAVLWRQDCDVGAQDAGFVYREVWFAPQQITVRETATAVQIAATGWWYGAISQVEAFPAGTAVSEETPFTLPFLLYAEDWELVLPALNTLLYAEDWQPTFPALNTLLYAEDWENP